MLRRRAPALGAALLALAATSLTACNATSYQNVPRPEAAAAGPAEGLCRIYVARSGQVWGKVRRVEVRDRGEVIGSIGADGYLCWEREPGHNPLQILYHGALLDDGVVEGLADFRGEPGGVYYYEVHLRETDRKPEIALLSSEEGRRLIELREPAPVRSPR